MSQLICCAIVGLCPWLPGMATDVMCFLPVLMYSSHDHVQQLNTCKPLLPLVVWQLAAREEANVTIDIT